MKLIIEVEKYSDWLGDEYLNMERIPVSVIPDSGYVTFKRNDAAYCIKTKDLKTILMLSEQENE